MAPIRRHTPTVIAVSGILILWQWWVSQAGIDPNVLPSPLRIAQAGAASWPTLWTAARITAAESLAGFLCAVILGVGLGMAFHISRTLRSALFPVLYAAQTMPLISIAPLFLIWFGFDVSGKIVIVAIFGLFPIAVQTVRGLESVPVFYRDVALTCGAGESWILWHVKLRVAARGIFGGIRISAAYTVATATTAEYLGSRGGLGIWLQAAYNSFRTPLVFCATAVIIAMTCMLLLAVQAVERLLLGPSDEESDDQSR